MLLPESPEGFMLYSAAFATKSFTPAGKASGSKVLLQKSLADSIKIGTISDKYSSCLSVLISVIRFTCAMSTESPTLHLRQS